MPTPKDTWIRADFNGFLDRDLLCLAHADEVTKLSGQTIRLAAGVVVTAFDMDADEDGNPDMILVTGSVEASPDFAQCRGSRWAVRVDESGVQWESELEPTDSR